MVALLFTTWLQGAMLPDLQTYYSYINKAELALLDSTYSSAINSFNEAFRFNAQPFIKDRYNLAVCYSLTSQHRKCYDQLTFVVDNGVSVYHLQQRDGLQGFFKSRFGTKLIAYERDHPRTFIAAYRAAIDSLVRMDQKFRLMPGGYDVYGDTIRAIDSMNVIAFNKLIALYGFPTEARIGVDSALGLNRPLFNVLIIHQQLGSRGRFWDYTPMMTKAADSGYIEIHAAAEYIWKYSGNDKYGVMNAGLVQLVLDSTGPANSPMQKSHRIGLPFGYFRIAPEKETTFNQQRSVSGLESLIEARRKTMFVQIEPRFVLPSSTVSVLVCNSLEQYNKMTSSIEWVQ